MTDGADIPPARRFYGRRRGRPLRAGMERLMAERLEALSIDPDALPTPIDPRDFFSSRPQQVWLEIGFGAGEHLSWQAKTHPDVGILGFEPFLNGVASLLRHVEDLGLENVRVHPDDARPVLDGLADGSVDRIFVLFPDPWPKVRHHFRRIIQTETLDTFARLLRPGGELRMASDDMPYVRWMLERATRHPAFQWCAEGPADWRERPSDWPETRYEAKARKAGRHPAFLRFRRL